MLKMCPHTIAYCPSARHHVNRLSPPLGPPSCRSCVLVLVPAIRSTLCPRLDARHHVNLVSPSWCPPSRQPCVPISVPAIMLTLCHPLGASHHVHRVSLFCFPPSCQPCVPSWCPQFSPSDVLRHCSPSFRYCALALVPTIMLIFYPLLFSPALKSSLNPRFGAHHNVKLVSPS